MVLLNNTMMLLIAKYFLKNENYVTSAKDHLHYLLGRNAMNISYVTGYGEKSVKSPHHRPSAADGIVKPVPGFVSGGPNKGLQDEFALDLQGQPPAKCFVDHENSYATNEITIYWNSPAVFVVSFFVNDQIRETF